MPRARVRASTPPPGNVSSSAAPVTSRFSFPALLIGCSCCCIVSVAFAYYMYALHEVRLWFSNIRQVEREISFRTESGLYYSYFKEFVAEKDFSNAFHNLQHDYMTEAPREINILQRFNVYQEVFLAILYKTLSAVRVVQIDPILFYTYACFLLSGLAIGSVFVLSWRLSGHFLFGVLTALWTFVDVDDATRVFFTVNLRENFALPFFWLQLFAIIGYLKGSDDYGSKVFIVIWTFLFSLLWQFNQFILLLESVSLLAMGFVFPEKVGQIIWIYGLEILAFSFLVVAQFLQSMLLGSLFLWFNISAIVVLSLRKSVLAELPRLTPLNRLRIVLINIITIFALAWTLSTTVKWQLSITADTHIWTFVKAKLGFAVGRLPFETALYICHGAFAFIDKGFFERTTTYGMLPLYLTFCVVVAILTLKRFFLTAQWPTSDGVGALLTAELLFITVFSLLTGVMAILTLRMKYVWFPLVAVLGAHALTAGDRFIGKYSKYAVIVALCWLMATNQYQIYKNQMANEQEFYDPDTVELMEWIAKTPASSIYAGSMQLMAGVKCCTGHPISNHPHFEDKWLRERTERLYQMYGRFSVERVHAMACLEGVDYIILEDSICLAGAKNGCSTPEVVDNNSAFSTADFTSERFCQAVKKQSQSKISKLFRLVFENPTFRVYHVRC